MRRALAFALDMIVITLIALAVYLAFSEVRSHFGGRPGMVSQALEAFRTDRSVTITLGPESSQEHIIRKSYMDHLKSVLSEEDYRRAGDMNAHELESAFHHELVESEEAPIIIRSGESFELIQELVVGYLYFILFFAFSGRTLGKRVFRLRVIDLKGRPRLGWYQAFERAHGYAASTLVALLGFFQVLWDSDGLTMHDKLAGTTVIRTKREKTARRTKPGKDIGEKDQDA